MLDLTDKHLEAIAKHVETMNFDPIVVGSEVKIKDYYNKNLKFVVIASHGDTMKLVYKAQLTSKTGAVIASSVITRTRYELTKLAGKIEIPAAWAELVK